MLFIKNILERPIKPTLSLLAFLLLSIVALSVVIMILNSILGDDTMYGGQRNYVLLMLRRVFVDLTIVNRVLIALGFLLLVCQTIYHWQRNNTKLSD